MRIIKPLNKKTRNRTDDELIGDSEQIGGLEYQTIDADVLLSRAASKKHTKNKYHTKSGFKTRKQKAQRRAAQFESNEEQSDLLAGFDAEFEGVSTAEGSLCAEGSLLAEGSLPAEGSLLAEGSLPAEGSLLAEGASTRAQVRGADDPKKEFSRLLVSAMRMLAMREHSIKEIYDKLSAKSEAPDIVNGVLDELIKNKYVSDQRFAESYVRMRGNKGFGPVKIRSELKNKGISNMLIAEFLDMNSPIWIDKAVEQHQKKYGLAELSDYNGWTKRARFMQSRGFTMEHIHIALPSVEFD